MKRTLTLVPWTRIPKQTIIEHNGMLLVLFDVTPTTFSVRPATPGERLRWHLRAPFMVLVSWVVLRFLTRGIVRDLLLAARQNVRSERSPPTP